MKKISILCVILLLCVSLVACYKAPDLDGIEIKEITYTQFRGKQGEWEHAQGLGTDGTYFYYAGHNDKTDEQADIHVIDMKTGQEISLLYRAGALHSAEVLYNPSSDTIWACSGGDGRRPYLFEIDKKTGAKLGEWYFDNVGENGGGLIARTPENKLVLLTSSQDGARLAFDIIVLQEKGKFVIEESYLFNSTDLGVPQGLEYYDGYVYYLADAGRTVSKNPHYIFKLKLADQKVNIITAYSIDFKYETEGMCIDTDGTVYMGDANECIYVFDKKIQEW